MQKKTIQVFGQTYYLLGKDKDGINYWLEKESWDCGWYWGFGYIETFTNNRQPTRSIDISSHQHFDGLFMNRNMEEAFHELLVETPFTKDEVYELCDYMKTFYTLREVAELFKHGYSHQTERARIESLKDNDQYDLVNKQWLPEVFKRVHQIVEPNNI